MSDRLLLLDNAQMYPRCAARIQGLTSPLCKQWAGMNLCYIPGSKARLWSRFTPVQSSLGGASKSSRHDQAEAATSSRQDQGNAGRHSGRAVDFRNRRSGPGRGSRSSEGGFKDGEESANGPSVTGTAAEALGGIPRVVLKRGKARLFREGNPIVYSGAVDCVVGKPPPNVGATVLVTDGAQNSIGWGIFNPHSMFRVRIMQLEEDVKRDQSCVLDMPRLIEARIAAAVHLRQMLGLPTPGWTDVYRLINSEGDRLSGLTVDILGPHIVVVSCAGWVERYQDHIQHALKEATGLSSVIWRRATDILKEEGLEVQPEEAGTAEDTPLQLLECGVKFVASLQGQKTGFYADQRENRAAIRSLAKGKTVLDLCCYSGGFAISAALGGASHVTGVDSSGPALDLASANASLNGLSSSQCSFVKSDIADYLEAAVEAGRTWDIVVLDPPKLAPSAKVLQRATARYRKLNALAMRAVAPGGLLMTCSCSGAMTQSGTFLMMLLQAATVAGRRISVLREAGAGPDHVLEPSYPEGVYLTNVLVRVL